MKLFRVGERKPKQLAQTSDYKFIYISLGDDKKK